MPKVSQKISTSYRYLLYIVLALSCFTGAGFWLVRHYFMVDGDFGVEPHFLQYPLLQAHGFLAFVMLLALGAIYASHVAKTWSSGRAKKSGTWLLSNTVLSLLSAYALYYLVNQEWHEFLGNTHAILGLLLPVGLIIHINIARKSRRVKKHHHKKRHHQSNHKGNR